jgi:hypothetical protein
MHARGTEIRQMQRALSIRVTPDDYAAIVEKAAGCGLPIAEFVRRCSLGRQTPARTDLQVVNELRRLGGLQKQLFSQDDERNRERYAELLLEIQAAIERVAAS